MLQLEHNLDQKKHSAPFSKFPIGMNQKKHLNFEITQVKNPSISLSTVVLHGSDTLPILDVGNP